MDSTLLKSQHAYAVRNNDSAEIERIEKELVKHGVVAKWLSDDVLLWTEDADNKKRPNKVVAPVGDHYPDKACSVCGGPIEKTGKSGRPPTKCKEHR